MARKRRKTQLPTECPVCHENALEVDEEYMLSTYGASYVHLPAKDWTLFCSSCEEAGTIEELEAVAQNKSQQEKSS